MKKLAELFDWSTDAVICDSENDVEMFEFAESA